MTHEQQYMCETQKELFEYSQRNVVDIRQYACDFLKSDFCNRCLDVRYSVYQYSDMMEWLDFLEKDCKIKPDAFQKDRVPFHVAGWLGYTYRQIWAETGLKSKDIIEKVAPNKLIISYPGLHTVDEDMAIDIIIKDFGL